MDHALVEIIGRGSNFPYNSSMTSLAHLPIPVVLFVLKKHSDLTGGDLRFADTSGDVIFKVNHQSSHNNKRPFLGSNGNPLIFIYYYHNGSWQGFKAGEDDQK
ncbi:hypothetical protein SO802_018487 [Lithocarpus litseifolius]|uniref:Uncharacterized protein n=1 Tax=Lithocarpus litseifolius TaxID=425828 RepID=A0AAW2CQ67_9ROSI